MERWFHLVVFNHRGAEGTKIHRMQQLKIVQSTHSVHVNCFNSPARLVFFGNLINKPTGTIYVFTTRLDCKLKKLCMAEIHVETKRKTTPAWLWLLLAVVVVAAIIYFAAKNKGSDNDNTTNKSKQTSYIESIARPVLT